MSQYAWVDIDPDTEDGTELSARLNAWVAATLSFHRDTAAPSYVVAGIEWQKTVSGTVEERYVYDGGQSLLLYTINPTAHTVQIPAANMPASSASVQGAVELATNAEQFTGTDATRASTPDSVAALWEKGADNTGGATITLGDGGSFNLITSTTAITAFAFTTDKAGRKARIRFNTARTLTHHATSLILPGGANIVTAQGDICEIESLGSGNFRVNWYTRANGTPVIPSPVAAVTSGTIDGAVIGGTTPSTVDATAFRSKVTTTIADDAVFTLNLPTGHAGCEVHVGGADISPAFMGCALVNAAPSGGTQLKAYGGTFFSVIGAQGVATGTSGTDGNMNVGADSSSHVYINNRVGSAVAVTITIIG